MRQMDDQAEDVGAKRNGKQVQRVPAPVPPLPLPAPPRDAIKQLTNRFLTLAMEELRREETQERVREQLVTPLVKIMSTQMMPYVMALFALVVVILITCIMTFTLFAMSYFGRQHT